MCQYVSSQGCYVAGNLAKVMSVRDFTSSARDLACYMYTCCPRPTGRVFWCRVTRTTTLYGPASRPAYSVHSYKLTCVESYVPVLQYISGLWDFCVTTY